MNRHRNRVLGLYLKLLSFIPSPTAIYLTSDLAPFTEDKAEKIPSLGVVFITRQSLQHTMVYPKGTVSGATANLAQSHNSDLERGTEMARKEHSSLEGLSLRLQTSFEP